MRTAHLLSFAALFGGHVYAVDAERLLPALVATIASGAALVGLDALRQPVSLLQVRGLASAAKVVLVVGVHFAWDLRVWLLAAAAVIGAVSSHMPGRYRYFSPFHGRVVGSTELG